MNRQQRRAAERAAARQPAPQGAQDEVAIGYLHPSDAISPAFSKSLIGLQTYDMVGAETPDGTRVGGARRLRYHLPLESGANIVSARNLLVRGFLSTDAEWLWMVDSDMEFHPQTLDMLLASADKDERPIVGGLCFAYLKGEAQQIVPTVYSFNAAGEMVRWNGYPEDQLFQVGGTGAACLLVHRRVFEEMATATVDEELAKATGAPAGALKYPPPWPWFAETITGHEWGKSASEDLTFCMRAGMCGFPIYVDSRIKIGHQKPFVIDEEMYRRYQPQAEPPAPTYVVIPVKGKFEYTESILKQLGEQGGFEHCFVYDNADSATGNVSDVHSGIIPHLQNRDRFSVIPAAGLGIHEMWNLGIKEAIKRDPRCNIAILNNDLELGPNFLAEMAKGLRAHPSVGAVSGNYDNRECAEIVQAVKGICAGRYDGTGGFAGFAFMIRSELVATLGGQVFDEQFRLWYGDNDLCLRLDALDITYGIVRDAHVVHIDGGSKTSGENPYQLHPDILEIVEEDRRRFEKKWAIEKATV